MKRVLITGENSYIGTSFASYLENNPEYQVNTISVRGEDWKTQDFSVYDVVFHVAGMVHQKETKNNINDYYDVNYKLTMEVAYKAKAEGISQFIYLSSMSVYGINEGLICKGTKPKPSSAYGKSKLLAEKFLQSIESQTFKVAILRPPMIYGKKCPGNYSKLSKLAQKTPFFLSINNKRSMIYIENLSIYITYILSNEETGIFFPQNIEYVKTMEMVSKIAKLHNKKIFFIKIPDVISNQIKRITIFKKVFGDLIYDIRDEHMNKMNKDFKSFNISIEESEND